MKKRRISCVVKNIDGDIVSVGIDGVIVSVEKLIQEWMNNRPLNLVVSDNQGNDVEVDIRPKGDTYYLVTMPDETLLNNLDYQPICS